MSPIYKKDYQKLCNLLFTYSFNTRNYNPAFGALYERLFAKENRKLALIAVCNTLLKRFLLGLNRAYYRMLVIKGG